MSDVNTKLTALADEVRGLSGTTAPKSIDAMISDIDTANTEVGTQTDLISQISSVLQNKAAGGEQAMPVISVDNSTGIITASAGTKSSTHQLTTQPAKFITPTKSPQPVVAPGVYTTGPITVNAIPSTYVEPTATKGAAIYTPSTSNQTIASGTYLTGTQTIKGDSNLKAENIKSGVTIFNVTGTASSGGVNTSDATATADEIFAGETAYGASGKVTGNFTIEEELAVQDDLILQIQSAVDSLPDAGSGGGGNIAPSGICPSLTVYFDSSMACDFIGYSSNNQYHIESFYQSPSPIVITNVDIGKPIFSVDIMAPDDTVIESYEHLEILYNSGKHFIVQCNSTEAATLQLTLGGWG